MFEWIGNKVVEFLAPVAGAAIGRNLPTVVQLGTVAYNVGSSTKKAVDQASAAVDKVRTVAGDVVASVAGGDPVGAVKAAKEATEKRVAELVLRHAEEKYASTIVTVIAVLVVFLIVRARRRT
jgi:hypothetical protein